ncbi:MAG: hypothetical protein VX237_09725 [Chloroflexota bacterium]|nr:hypothetical protein [Chloroflexota bacterium]
MELDIYYLGWQGWQTWCLLGLIAGLCVFYIWHKAKAKSLSYNSREDWEEELEYQAQQDEYLDRISEADHAYDSLELADDEGNIIHPAHLDPELR